MKDKALRLALEALEKSRVFVTTREKIKHPEGTDWYDEAITAIKQALANDALDKMAENERELGIQMQPEPEPLGIAEDWLDDWMLAKSGIDGNTKIYTSPPKREPLTDEMKRQMKERYDSMEMRGAFADGWLNAEAAHGIKEKNT